MPKVRTFIAVDVPATSQGKLVHLQSLLRTVPGDVRWATGPHLHITLRFLGEIESEVISTVEEATVRAVRNVPPFSCNLKGVGLFPPSGRPSVVWVGVAAGAPELTALQAAVEEQLGGIGFSPEKRPFTPHVTLGRIKAGARGPWEQVLDRLGGESFGEFPVREVLLFKSDLTPRGPIYTVLRRVPINESASITEGR